MREDRWPKVCLEEILRKGRNGQPTGWLQEINNIFINGDRPNFLEELLTDRPVEEITDVPKTIWDAIEMWKKLIVSIWRSAKR